MQVIPKVEQAYAQDVAARWWRELGQGETTQKQLLHRLDQLYAPRAVLVRCELNRLRLARQRRVYSYQLNEAEQEQLLADYNAALSQGVRHAAEQ